MYHLVVEALLAQPGQHFISDYLERRDMLPGFREGMRHVALDEQRHIGFGVKLLHDLARRTREVPAAVADLLREVTPYTLAVFIPPGWDRPTPSASASRSRRSTTEGARSLETKLRAAGLPLESLPGPPVMPLELPLPERAERGLAHAARRLSWPAARRRRRATRRRWRSCSTRSAARSTPAPRRRARYAAVGVRGRRAVARARRQRRDRCCARPRATGST